MKSKAARSITAAFIGIGAILYSTNAAADEPPDCYYEGTCQCIQTSNGYWFCWYI